MNDIVRELVLNEKRMDVAHAAFGIYFPFVIEPYIYHMASSVAEEYSGAYWEFYRLNNGGFYMAPDVDNVFSVVCPNGYEGVLSADALGISACLYAFSHLSFRNDECAETCAKHYHLLREYMFERPEVGTILRAID